MQTSLWLLLAAVVLGVVDRYLAGNTQGWPQPQGLGLTLVVLLNILGGSVSLVLLRRERYKSLLYFVPAGLAAVGLSWRASPWLINLDLMVIFMSMALALVSAHKGKPVMSGVVVAFSEFFNRLPICGAIDLLVDDIRWRDVMSDGVRAVIAGTLKGLFIAMPLVLFFSLMFCCADQAFARQVERIFKVDFWQMMERIGTASFFAVIAAGTLRTMQSSKVKEKTKRGPMGTTYDCAVRLADVLKVPKPVGEGNVEDEGGADAEGDPGDGSGINSGSEAVNAPKKGNLGFTETATILGALNLLFASFVGIQVRYLFGGSKLVEVTPGLTYAEYARHGFFELCWVAVLLIPLLLSLDFGCKRLGKASEIAFKSLAGTMLALLSVVIYSAVQRMSLYSQEYGYTELRLYTTGFMYWMTSVCVIFGLTVLRKQRERFVPLAYVSGLVSIAILHFYNPDAEIMRVNIAMNNKHIIDQEYSLRLSEDSIPVLLDGIEKLYPPEQKAFAQELLARKNGALKTDWRSFNWSKTCAYLAVENNMDKLQKLANN